MRFDFSRLLVSTAVLVWAFSARADELPAHPRGALESGVAEFTHAGRVTPRSSVDLAVRLDQVDDILKSLTVFDREGAIGAVSLPGKAPLAELFRDLPFGPEALEFAARAPQCAGWQRDRNRRTGHREGPRLQGRGRGSGVAGQRRHRHAASPDADDRSRPRPAILEDVTALRFSDPQAKAQVERALAGLTENRAKERRSLSIGFLRRRAAQRCHQLHGCRADLEDGVSPGASQGRRQRPPAGLGGAGKSDRRRLAGHRACPRVGQSGGASPAALHRVFRRPSPKFLWSLQLGSYPAPTIRRRRRSSVTRGPRQKLRTWRRGSRSARTRWCNRLESRRNVRPRHLRPHHRRRASAPR